MISTELAAVVVSGIVGVGGLLVSLWGKRDDRKTQVDLKTRELAHALEMRRLDEELAHRRTWWGKREDAYKGIQEFLVQYQRVMWRLLALGTRKPEDERPATESDEAVALDLLKQYRRAMDLQVVGGVYWSPTVRQHFVRLRNGLMSMHEAVVTEDSKPMREGASIDYMELQRLISEELRLGPSGAPDDAVSDPETSRSDLPEAPPPDLT